MGEGRRVEFVECVQAQGVALVTFSRPKSRNALSQALVQEVDQQLQALAARRDTRVVVLTGGPDVFSVGADLKERASLAPEEWELHHAAFERLTRRLQEMPQPTIAAVQGWALGGGSEIALGCDIVVASPQARFGQPEAKRGLVPGMGGPQLLQRRVPFGMAAYLLYTGAVVDAARAERMGIVTFVDPDPLERAMAIGREIAAASPVAVRQLRGLLRGESARFEERYREELQAWRQAVASGHALEGARAFAEGRAPEFSDE